MDGADEYKGQNVIENQSVKNLLAMLSREYLHEVMRRGKAIAIFGAKEIFSDGGFKSKIVKERFSGLREKYEGLYVIKIRNSDQKKGSAQLETIAEKLRGNIPVICFVDEPSDKVLFSTSQATAPKDEIDHLLFIDRLASFVEHDAFVVPNLEQGIPEEWSNKLPQTPIEALFGAALDARAINVERQVKVAPFVVDFLITSGKKMVVVEADGITFHNAESDAQRDSQIKETTDLDTLRFSSTEIFRDVDACADFVVEYLQKSATRNQEYRFEALGLDTSQELAVNHGHGHARVLAPAGSGKTMVLVNRIVAMLNEGCRPDAILALAFNTKAAEQLRKRLSDLDVDNVYPMEKVNGVNISTFNSFGHRIVRPEFGNYGILQGKEERQFVDSAISRSGINLVPMRGEDPVGDVIAATARVRRGLVPYNSETLEFKQPKGVVTTDLGDIWLSMRQAQESMKLLTFDDQIYSALNLLLNDPVLRRELQRRYRFILVDEYQDLNDAQVLLLRTLLGGGGKIFAVGDDDQLIYSWRQAKPIFLLDDFEKYYPGTKTYTLQKNYRSAKAIVRISQRLISYNKDRYPKEILPHQDASAGNVSLCSGEGYKEIGNGLGEFFLECKKKGNLHFGEMAVLARTKVQLLSAAMALDQKGIPRGQLPQIRLYSTPLGRKLFNYLCLLQDPWKCSGEMLAYIINRPNRYTTGNFVELLKSVERPWLAVLIMAHGCTGKYDPNRHLLHLVKTVSELDLTVNSPPIEWIDHLCNHVEICESELSDVKDADEATDEVILHVLREESRGFLNLADYLSHIQEMIEEERSDIEVRKKSDASESDKKTTLNEKKTEIVRVVRAEDEQDEGGRVSLMTIHSAKGREWAAVSLYDSSEERQTGKKSETKFSTPQQIEEERRVFYVGLTRAMRFLQVSFIEKRPSTFVIEAFVPKEITSLSEKQFQEAIERAEIKIKSLNDRIRSVQDTLPKFEDKISEWRSGVHRIEIEKERTSLQQNIKNLSTRYEEIEKIKAGNLFERIFSNAPSSKDLSQQMNSLDNQLYNLRKDQDKIDYELDAYPALSEKEVRKYEGLIVKSKNELSNLETELLEISGSLEDLTRLLHEGEHLERASST
jgi:DNA helicase II / ATP-dependent DNA helicase PcrA